MNHIAYVYLVFQELHDRRAAPLLAVAASRRPLSRLLKLILGGRVCALSVELGGDISPTVAARELAEEPFDYLGGDRPWRCRSYH